jgi:hypothetical protein
MALSVAVEMLNLRMRARVAHRATPVRLRKAALAARRRASVPAADARPPAGGDPEGSESTKRGPD